jgi:opacity protein-like surface antigen
MKTFLLTISMTFVLLSAAFFSSAAGQSSAQEKVLIDNAQHYVGYRVDGRNVILTVELIADFTDNTRGDFPNIDFTGFAVDVDQNGAVSGGSDTYYGLTGKPFWQKRDWDKDPFVTGICTNFLLDGTRSTGCGGFKSNAALDFGFRATNKQAEKHPVFIFTIPRAELSADGKSAHLRLHVYSAGKGSTYYPAKATGESYHSFDKVLKLEF